MAKDFLDCCFNNFYNGRQNSDFGSVLCQIGTELARLSTELLQRARSQHLFARRIRNHMQIPVYRIPLFIDQS
jgi:hypothetical protein